MAAQIPDSYLLQDKEFSTVSIRKTIWLVPLFLIVLASCGPIAVPQTQATFTPQPLPATWTPTLAPTVIPTFTEFPTFTPVPPISLPASPTHDFLADLVARFSDSLPSPNGDWIAEREPKKLLVKSQNSRRVWTLPCELFDECSTVFPVRWSRDGQILYFAPAPVTGGPAGLPLVTALATIDVTTGKWQLLLPDSVGYDFTFSPDDEQIAFTRSSGYDAQEPSVTVGILRLRNKKVQGEQTLDETFAGDIVWSPYKSRIVFQTRDPEGSSVIFYDLETGLIKYVLQDEQADLDLSVWNDADNTVMIETRGWQTYRRSYWHLNPFTGEMTSASITSTPTTTTTPATQTPTP